MMMMMSYESVPSFAYSQGNPGVSSLWEEVTQMPPSLLQQKGSCGSPETPNQSTVLELLKKPQTSSFPQIM